MRYQPLFCPSLRFHSLKSIFVVAINLVFTATTFSQGGKGLISPQIHNNRSITFRLLAPRAKAVRLLGSLAGQGTVMRRNNRGLWSVTVGPVKPDLYGYKFEVDGLTIVDPSNPEGRLGRWPESLVEVPADPPSLHSLRRVPHGEIHQHIYASKSLEVTRRLFVYLPPSYEQDGKDLYPVLYLLHGSGDDASTWTGPGRANLILDNLTAEGHVKPMIVVMPYGHAELPQGARGQRNSQLSDINAFSMDLLNDVTPFVEKRYRVRSDADHRAIVGLSMGGGQSLRIGLGHLDSFHWVGGFSSYLPGRMENLFAALAQDPQGAREKLRLLWIGCGKDDFLVAQNTRFHQWLQEKKVEHIHRPTEGGHSWPVWRRYLAEFLPLLFK